MPNNPVPPTTAAPADRLMLTSSSVRAGADGATAYQCGAQGGFCFAGED